MPERQVDAEIVIDHGPVKVLRRPRTVISGLRFEAFEVTTMGASPARISPGLIGAMLFLAIFSIQAQFPRSTLVNSLSRTFKGPAITPSLMKISTSA